MQQEVAAAFKERVREQEIRIAKYHEVLQLVEAGKPVHMYFTIYGWADAEHEVEAPLSEIERVLNEALDKWLATNAKRTEKLPSADDVELVISVNGEGTAGISFFADGDLIEGVYPESPEFTHLVHRVLTERRLKKRHADEKPLYDKLSDQ